jgi:molecular chaperone DnaK (HSP70)
MLLESFEHAEADFAARLLIEAKNEAESVVLATEKTFRSPEFPAVAKDELVAGEQKRIEQALAGLKHVMQSSDRDAILQWTKVLNDATQHLAEVMMNRSVKAALTGKNIQAL